MLLIPGLNWCNQRNILFVPVIWPGFSWYNLKPFGIQNEVRRNKGTFLWAQAHRSLLIGCKSLYFAMLDEVDEGTAFMKTAENAEQSPAQEFWLNLDADGYDLPSDWYMRIAGKATETLRGNLPNQPTLGTPKPNGVTIRPVQNDCRLTFLFPDFEDVTELQISLDGGNTFPYTVSDKVGVFEIGQLEEGTYQVFVRDSKPGSESVPMGRVCVVAPCLTTSVNDPRTEVSGISISPNPTRNTFSFRDLEGTYQVLIYDVLGKEQKAFTSVSANQLLDISDLPDAVYMVLLKGTSANYIAKIVKN